MTDFARCVPPPIGCGGVVVGFYNDRSRKEYGITGLCQACQDKFFKTKPPKPVPVRFKGRRYLVCAPKFMENMRPCIVLAGSRGASDFIRVSLNIPDVPLADDETIIKTYDGNEGILEILIKAGVLALTDRRVVDTSEQTIAESHDGGPLTVVGVSPNNPGGILPICRILVDLPMTDY